MMFEFRAFRSLSGHKGGAFVNGISLLIKEATARFSPLPTWEDREKMDPSTNEPETRH